MRYTTTTSLNLREAHDVSSRVVITMPAGAKFDRTGATTGWIRGTYRKGLRVYKGWASARSLQAETAPPVLGDVDKLIERAESQVGYIESPAGSNRTTYGKWYGMNGQPWCAIFITWLFFKTGLDAAIGSKHFAYTPSFAAWFKEQGRWGTKPKRGAIAFFDFPDSVDRIQHAELVIGVNRLTSSITTIGGNTSSGDAGSQSNGGMVARRTRRGSSIVGYGYPF